MIDLEHFIDPSLKTNYRPTEILERLTTRSKGRGCRGPTAEKRRQTHPEFNNGPRRKTAATTEEDGGIL
jgi:hypothetical protein